MKLVIPVYNGVDLLDVAGPYEMFKWVPATHRLEVTIVSADGAAVETGTGLRIEAQASFADVPHADILWTPGGEIPALRRIWTDPSSRYLPYLKQLAGGASWICSVCEGALLLGEAGLLAGHEVTTHWAFVDCLSRFPGVTRAPGYPRFVVSGNRLTGGGISSGLDEALKLIELLFGQAAAEQAQVTTQYFPDPPVNGKLPATPPACPLTW